MRDPALARFEAAWDRDKKEGKAKERADQQAQKRRDADDQAAMARELTRMMLAEVQASRGRRGAAGAGAGLSSSSQAGSGAQLQTVPAVPFRRLCPAGGCAVLLRSTRRLGRPASAVPSPASPPHILPPAASAAPSPTCHPHIPMPGAPAAPSPASPPHGDMAVSETNVPTQGSGRRGLRLLRWHESPWQFM